MMVRRFLLALVFLLVTAGCGGGAGADAPTNASADDFCTAKDWFVNEGMVRLSGGDFPPSNDALAALGQDWARELSRVGTPENVTPEARAGFEKFVDRLDKIDGGDMSSFGWDGQESMDDDEAAFANYLTNTCG